jgi:hypothetical protein
MHPQKIRLTKLAGTGLHLERYYVRCSREL